MLNINGWSLFKSISFLLVCSSKRTQGRLIGKLGLHQINSSNSDNCVRVPKLQFILFWPWCLYCLIMSLFPHKSPNVCMLIFPKYTLSPEFLSFFNFISFKFLAENQYIQGPFSVSRKFIVLGDLVIQWQWHQYVPCGSLSSMRKKPEVVVVKARLESLGVLVKERDPYLILWTFLFFLVTFYSIPSQMFITKSIGKDRETV